MKKFACAILILLFLAMLLPGITSTLAYSDHSVKTPSSFNFNTVWLQINTDGFGSSANDGVISLAVFNGAVYAGTHNNAGAQLWRRQNDAWQQIVNDGFGDAHNIAINSLISYKGYLYAGTANYINDTTSDGAQIWRSPSGDPGSWTQVVDNGSGGATPDSANFKFFYFFTLNTPPDHICATTLSDTNQHGAEIWCSADGATNWTNRISNGFNDSAVVGINSMAEYNGHLYFAASNINGGGKVWRTDLTLGTPTLVNDPGFGVPENISVSSLAVYNGYLYAATHHASGGGLQVYRCQGCSSKADWSKVVDNGFGNPFTRYVPGLVVFHNQLFLVAGNEKVPNPFESDGMEVWGTADGAQNTWRQYVSGGFDDVNNWSPYYGNSQLVYNDLLYIGTNNSLTGGELWEFLSFNIYVPFLKK